jgi:hypothetical protein
MRTVARLCRERAGAMSNVASRSIEKSAGSFDEAAEDMLNDYKANRKRTFVDAKRRIKKHLAPFFGNRRMITITTTELRAYVAKRLADGTPFRHKGERRAKEEGSVPNVPRKPVSAGEINRELTVLKRMFSLAVQAGKLVKKPHFPMLRENNVRAGSSSARSYSISVRHCRRPCNQLTFAYVGVGASPARSCPAVAAGRFEGRRGPARSRHDEESRRARLLSDV